MAISLTSLATLINRFGSRVYMARLGPFQFGIETAAFDQLQRSASYQWEAKSRIGRKPAHQFTGAGADTLTLSGVIYPHYKGGLGQLGAMRQIAGTGQPQPLVYSFERVGQYCGRWCITSVEESRTVFFEDGRPRKIEFSISLVEYGEDGGNGVANMAAAIASAAGIGSSQAGGLASTFSDFVQLATTVAAESGAISGSLAGQLQTLAGASTYLGGNYERVTGAVTSSIVVASSIKTDSERSRAMAGDTPNTNRILTASQILAQDGGRSLAIASRSSQDINAAYSTLSSTTHPEVVASMRGAQRNAGSLSKLIANTTIGAIRIREALA